MMKDNEKEFKKFIMNPAFRERAIKKIHKEQDNRYNSCIKKLKNEKSKLIDLRIAEIKRISNSRWESISGGKFFVNRTEGKVLINQSENLFSNINGAELNMQMGYRIVTTEQSKSKKHASLGGAVLGGMVLGPVGVVVGGVGLGKTKMKGSSNSNQIPICNFIGVIVNLSGFTSEIIILSSVVDQGSAKYQVAYNEAQNIISILGTLAKTPVPQNFLNPDQEISVKNYDYKIEEKEEQIQYAISDKPKYELPKFYRSKEQSSMSDEEYLLYLKSENQQYEEEILISKEKLKQQKATEKEIIYKEKIQRKKQRKENKKEEQEEKQAVKQEVKQVVKQIQKAENKNFQKIYEKDKLERNQNDKVKFNHIIKKILNIFIAIIFWTLSISLFIFSLLAIINTIIAQNSILSAIMLMLTAFLINPYINKQINNKLFKIPRWACVVIFFIGFIFSIILLPS